MPEATLTAPIRRLKETELVFQVHLGDGDLNGRKFVFGAALPSGGLVVEFEPRPDEEGLGRDRFLVAMEDVMAALAAAVVEVADAG